MFSITSFVAMAPNQQYLQSVQAITGYNQFITDQSVPGGLPDAPAIGQATAALTQSRQVSLTWFNQVYPGCLNLPQQITTSSAAITGGLQELTDLAAQLAADPGNAQLAQAIASTANQLAGEVGQLQTSCSGMARALSDYANSLQQAAQNLMSSLGSLQSLLCQQHAQLCNDIARLNSLQHATCPNQGDINAAIGVVQNDQQALLSTDSFAVQIDNCGRSAGGAVSGLNYLAGYWMQLASLAGQAQQALQQVSGRPAVLIQLDLTAASNAWQGLLDQLSSITTLAAAVS
ncbi:MAG TPA: hypothetical protein VFU36_01285 [Jatrophihabitans sp.]|nr:hypothetical protein [Jatrophihabitans sp.]